MVVSAVFQLTNILLFKTTNYFNQFFGCFDHIMLVEIKSEVTNFKLVILTINFFTVNCTSHFSHR